MIALENTLIADAVIEDHFVCDLNACKGGCCVEGDCGAPLTKEETKILKRIYPKMRHLLPTEFQQEIDTQGTHTTDNEYGYVTPTMDSGICVYAYHDAMGIVKCGIEKAWKEGIIDFQKPLSCHLFPIRIKEKNGYSLINYEPREQLCAAACEQGGRLQVPVYEFLKEALVRRFGAEYYNELSQLAYDYKSHKSSTT